MFDPIILIVAGSVFGAVVLLVMYSFTTVESKLSGRSSLRAIETYTWQGDEQVVEEQAFFDRVIAPLNGKAVELGKRFTPVGYVESTRKKLLIAGKRGPEEVDKFLAKRVISLALMPVAIFLALAVIPGSPMMKLMVAGLLALILGLGPDSQLNRVVGARQKAIRRALPDVLDLLTISVEAGLGFEQAIDRITDSVPGPLTDEFNRMIGEMRAGAGRAEALQGLEMRTGVEEVRSFVNSMVQADTFGVSIGRVLRAQADEMRIKRRQLAQEAAMKAPVKMLLPMTFFIFPALFVVILGPAAINIIANFK